MCIVQDKVIAVYWCLVFNRVTILMSKYSTK